MILYLYFWLYSKFLCSSPIIPRMCLKFFSVILKPILKVYCQASKSIFLYTRLVFLVIEMYLSQHISQNMSLHMSLYMSLHMSLLDL